ncbi:MAG: hypothetical protein HON44_10490 [Glaciecola sp.]|nr:hypothetical protein [Glaciecola sp.]
MHRLLKLIAFATIASYALVALLVWFIYHKTLIHNHYMAVVIFSFLPLLINSNDVSDTAASFYFSGLLANLLLLLSESVNLIITPETFLIFICFYALANLLYIISWLFHTAQFTKTKPLETESK